MLIRYNYAKLMVKYPYSQYASSNYKIYRNKVTNMIKAEKKRFVNQYFEENAHDAKKNMGTIKISCL